MKHAPGLFAAIALAAAGTLATPAAQAPPSTFRFEIDIAPELFPKDVVPRSLDGRLLLIVSNDRSQEPRFQVGRGLTSQLLFGDRRGRDESRAEQQLRAAAARGL